MHAYRISGLSVQSEIDLPGAVPAMSADAPDLVVRQGAVPKALADPGASGPAWQRSGDDFLLCVPQVGRFLISDGSSITVDVDSTATLRDASIFIMGSSIGIALHQRGALPLHGSCVARDGRALMLCGPSGQGKSTTAAALCKRGFTLVADDISVIGFDAGGGLPIVWPDGRQLKLWRGAIDRLGLAAATPDPVREGLDKYFVSPFAAAIDPPILSAIYLLRVAPAASGATIEQVRLPGAMRTLEEQAYRPRLRRELSTPKQAVAQAAAVLRHSALFTLERPLGFDRLDEMLDALVRHWQTV
jgi:hypothetical protein